MMPDQDQWRRRKQSMPYKRNESRSSLDGRSGYGDRWSGKVEHKSNEYYRIDAYNRRPHMPPQGATMSPNRTGFHGRPPPPPPTRAKRSHVGNLGSNSYPPKRVNPQKNNSLHSSMEYDMPPRVLPPRSTFIDPMPRPDAFSRDRSRAASPSTNRSSNPAVMTVSQSIVQPAASDFRPAHKPSYPMLVHFDGVTSVEEVDLTLTDDEGETEDESPPPPPSASMSEKRDEENPLVQSNADRQVRTKVEARAIKMPIIWPHERNHNLGFRELTEMANSVVKRNTKEVVEFTTTPLHLKVDNTIGPSVWGPDDEGHRGTSEKLGDDVTNTSGVSLLAVDASVGISPQAQPQRESDIQEVNGDNCATVPVLKFTDTEDSDAMEVEYEASDILDSNKSVESMEAKVPPNVIQIRNALLEASEASSGKINQNSYVPSRPDKINSYHPPLTTMLHDIIPEQEMDAISKILPWTKEVDFEELARSLSCVLLSHEVGKFVQKEIFVNKGCTNEASSYLDTPFNGRGYHLQYGI
eukprot:GHVH01017397.1.p1 GENE.GHVH01017397.1~~GHVH01017397.1.p1  ORF type:complete len:524 (+),score=62.57 GHVH01017397.1:41-1612(+)